MEGHQRNLYLYDRFNARVAGVSRDNVETLRPWVKDLGLTFPIFSNPVGFMGIWFETLEEGYPMFSRKTVIIDKSGTIRYLRDGAPDYQDILLKLREIDKEHQE